MAAAVANLRPHRIRSPPSSSCSSHLPALMPVHAPYFPAEQAPASAERPSPPSTRGMMMARQFFQNARHLEVRWPRANASSSEAEGRRCMPCMLKPPRQAWDGAATGEKPLGKRSPRPTPPATCHYGA
eukprot:361118-Chlamydomonas_euryale.AAC.5